MLKEKRARDLGALPSNTRKGVSAKRGGGGEILQRGQKQGKEGVLFIGKGTRMKRIIKGNAGGGKKSHLRI